MGSQQMHGPRRHSAGLTDVGQKRVANEDAFVSDDDLGLYIVADGMGGHAAGEVASQEAIEAALSMVRRGRPLMHSALDNLEDPELLRPVTRLLESAAQAATYMVYAIAQNEPESQGMGTTLSALLLLGRKGITAQVGDSRVYLVREGQVTLLTEDHTLVAWQIKQGIISPEEAEYSPHKNVITRAVGSREYVQADMGVFDVEPGDAFLICSDGLHGYLEEPEIPQIMNLGPKTAVRRFIDTANQRGGRDNITAIVVEVV